jgi:hypothetical protein
MADANRDRAEAEIVEIEEAVAPQASPAGEAADPSIERLLAHVAAVAPAPEVAPALRTARVVAIAAGTARITWRGLRDPVDAELDEGVDSELVQRAMENGDRVLVEIDPALGPLVVGVVQRRIPAKVEIRGETVVIEADREVVIRSGRGAMRIRDDGDIEVVGSRISTMSRGLFRIVGRVLRLN